MEFDPNVQTKVRLLWGDEIPPYVTIEELQELLKDKAYQTKWDDYILGLKSGEVKELAPSPDGFFLVPDWISSQLLVQTCMQDIEAYNWAKITEYYNIFRIAEIAYIACHPYIWQSIEDRDPDTIIQGRIATMKYDSTYPSIKWLNKMVNERVLFLADKNPCAIIDTYLKGEGKVLKGMLLWNLLVTDGRNYIKESLVEEVPEGADTSIKYFHAESFRENLQYIAEERGAKVAAELLRKLRKDWPSIVAWKCFGIDTLKPEQVEKFRCCLFEGMDYYLEQWEIEQPKQPKPKKEPRPTPKSITFKMGTITDGHLQMLRLKLIDAGWIAKDTQPDDFGKLFSGKLNSTKIIWTGNVGKGMLVFLFNKMVEQGFIVVPANHSITTILEAHFIDTNGKSLSGLNSSKESTKHLPIVKECLESLEIEIETD